MWERCHVHIAQHNEESECFYPIGMHCRV
jgi:hypothetical protein